ncbi:GAF domain-containing protein [Vacuolonema iberomarrocanum]|uniref:sensor histidine kinase n=1 Tax=Vacuolonema iberomarrocanum TaxID=3454632 RepID=UPI0019F773F6|nr:GAF domain-containing protein [filamentous cyanobacterium LEGE 07170]
MGSPKQPANHENQLVVLKQTLQALHDAETEEILLDTVLHYLKQELDYTVIWIGRYDLANHRLTGKGGSIVGSEMTAIKQPFSLAPGDLLEQVVIQQRPIGVPDLREEPRAGDWRRLAKKYGIQGTIIFPIRHRDRCLGVILLGSALWGVSPHAEEKARLSILLGTLAAALYQLEEDSIRQQAKRPAEPLMTLMGKLRSLPNLEARLDAVVIETHRFIAPTSTNVYWFESDRRYFWWRTGNRKERLGEPTTNGFTAQEINSFYQAMAADQIVSIGEAQSSLKADMAGLLMQKIQARSLLAAPILLRDELFGFIAVEGKEPRIWSEEEKTYLRSVAQLIALTAPLDEMEATVQQVKVDQTLTAEIAQSIFSEADWEVTLQQTAQILCQRLRASYFLVLLYSPDQELFEVCHQHRPPHRQALPAYLNGLNPVDWNMLERSAGAVAVENLEDDLKLMAWRSDLLNIGMQSILVCSTAPGHPLEALLVVGQESARTWNRDEREVLRIVSQQLGITLHQWQLQRQTEQQNHVNQMIQWGITALQQTPLLEVLERAAMEQIARVLDAPLAVLITWPTRHQIAKISAAIIGNAKFGVNLDASIPTLTDPLLNWAVQAEGVVPVSRGEIDAETRQWLNGVEIGQVLALGLHTASDHEVTGIIVVADEANRYWPERQLNALAALGNQLAWSRRHLLMTNTLSGQRAHLERLNWYKHRRIEEIFRALSVNVKRLNELSHQKDALASMRYHQILRQLGNMLSTMAPLLKHEQWQMKTSFGTIALTSLLKRSMERVEGLIHQRQLWSQVHNDSVVDIGGDIHKIELVLGEILTMACFRSPVGGRLDIWCRPLDAHWLEISITDNGMVEPLLLEELTNGRPADWLAPSILDRPPGLHLAICQTLMAQLNGEFNLFQLEDGRILSRLLLPIATGPR